MMPMAANLDLRCQSHPLPHADLWNRRTAGRPANRTVTFAEGRHHSLSRRVFGSRCSTRRSRSDVCRAASTNETASGELPAALAKIVTTFSAVPDAKLKYQQLLFLGKKLPPMPANLHTDGNLVPGCVSQVWVHPDVKDGKLFWLADSDSALTKGLAALLVQGLSDCTPEDVVRIKPDFIEKMGLGQALTPSRSNGFLNMFKLMQAKALQLANQ